ncbi:hypothetical protein FB451DRAFT_1350876 [Mycena latifolia]|nr:hypothetical protein FB451DRAFT_1350876 [Mycena latifolia]
MVLSPLIGDVQGRYRVHSAVGKALAALLDVPYICLDTLFWKPGWDKETNEQFRLNVEHALADAPHGWVIDGNYGRRIGTVVEDSATDVVCACLWRPEIDPPLALYFPRIVLCTFLRMLGRAEPCNLGCPERWRDVFFSRESMIVWCLTHHALVRRRDGARMARIGLREGQRVEGQKMRRMGEWGGELRAWMRDVREMMQV